MSQFLPIAVALSIGLGTIGAGLGIGLAAAQAFAAIGRNPDAEPIIRTNLFVCLGLSEGLAVFALMVSVLLQFHIPQ